MAVSRLLHPKSGVPFSSRRFDRSTRNFSSSSNRSNTEKLSEFKSHEAGKDETAVETESSVKKDIAENQKRGSRYFFGSLLRNIRDKIVKKPQLLGESGGEAADTSQSNTNDKTVEPSNDSLSAEAKVALSVLTGSSDHIAAEGTSSISAKEADNYSNENKIEKFETMTESSESLRKEGVNGKKIILGSSFPHSSDNLKIDSESTNECTPAKKVCQSDGRWVSGLRTLFVGEENSSLSSSQRNDLNNLRLVKKQIEEALLVKEKNHDNKQEMEDYSLFSVTFGLSKQASTRCAVEKPELPSKRAQNQLGQAVPKRAQDKMQASYGEYLSCLNGKEPNINPKAAAEEMSKDMGFVDDRNGQTDQTTSSPVEEAGAWMNGVLKAQDDVQNDNGFKDKFEGRIYDGYVENKGCKTKGFVGNFGNSNGSTRTDEGDDDDLRSLMSCIKQLPGGKVSNSGKSHPLAPLEHNNLKHNQKPYEGCSLENKSTKSHASKEERNVIDSMPLSQLAFQTSQQDSQKSLYDSSGGEPLGNEVLVRFLSKKLNKVDILNAFRSDGKILNIKEVPPTRGRHFKDAFITFQKGEGFEKELRKTDAFKTYSDVVVKATSLEDTPARIHVPDLIGDPDVPIALVKNPTKTVKITPFTPNMTSHQVEEALAFCRSDVTSFFLGSSSSIAFVEFETERAKERALAEHSIYVSGKQLLISRIDVPRTNVVRLFTTAPVAETKLKSICRMYGKLKKIQRRLDRVVDVHFKLSSWPDMLKILNSLNGKKVEGRQWIAQPAPIVPPEILTVLWNQPEEQKHVIAMIESLVRIVGEPLDVAQISELTSKLFAKRTQN